MKKRNFESLFLPEENRLTPRENSDIIHAYADGHDVEFAFNSTHSINYIKWTPDCKPHLGDPRYEWRIKYDNDPEDFWP
jgi:hypothetical protein